MIGHRAQRIGDQIRRTLAELLHEELRDPRIGFVTITDVNLSPDLRHAVVYVTVMEPAEQHEASLDALNRAVPFLRRALAQRAGLRFTPELRFRYDQAFESGQRLESLLQGLRDPDPEDREDRLNGELTGER